MISGSLHLFMIIVVLVVIAGRLLNVHGVGREETEKRARYINNGEELLAAE